MLPAPSPPGRQEGFAGGHEVELDKVPVALEEGVLCPQLGRCFLKSTLEFPLNYAKHLGEMEPKKLEGRQHKANLDVFI